MTPDRLCLSRNLPTLSKLQNVGQKLLAMFFTAPLMSIGPVVMAPFLFLRFVPDHLCLLSFSLGQSI